MDGDGLPGIRLSENDKNGRRQREHNRARARFRPFSNCVLNCPFGPFWPWSRVKATVNAGTRKLLGHEGQSSFREGIKPLRKL